MRFDWTHLDTLDTCTKPTSFEKCKNNNLRK